MMVAEPGMSHDELLAFAESDPAVKAGLLRVAVRPWMPAVRAGDGTV
jgi:hypothetical protein